MQAPPQAPICRIGVYYDAAYMQTVQAGYAERGLGRMVFQPLQMLLEQTVQHAEKGYNSYRIVAAGWYVGVANDTAAIQHSHHPDLLRAGITAYPVWLDAPPDARGVAVTLAADALEVGLGGRMDVAVLVAADAYLAALARTLTRNGVRVLLAHFTLREDLPTTMLDRRLRDACSYVVNLAQFEHTAERHWQALFQGLFRPLTDGQEQAE